MANAYGTESNVRPLLGNVTPQQIKDDPDLKDALDWAKAKVNTLTGHQDVDWNSGDGDDIFTMVREATWKFAAIRALIGKGQDNTRRALLFEVQDDIKNINELSETGDQFLVEMSEPVSWPAKDNGLIWTTKHPPLRKKSLIEYEPTIDFTSDWTQFGH